MKNTYHIFIDARKYLLHICLILGLILYFAIIFLTKQAVNEYAQDLPVPPSELPPDYLYWISLALILAPFAWINAPKKIRVASLIIATFLFFSSFPILSQFQLPYGRDAQYTWQSAYIIDESGVWEPISGTGQARSYSNYPGLYIYSLMLSYSTGVDVNASIMWGLSLLRVLMIMGLLYLLLRQYIPQKWALTGSSIYLAAPSLTNHPHHEGFAIIFAILILYAISRLQKRESPVAKIMLLFGLLMLVISHHFTTYVTIGWLLFIFIFQHVHKGKKWFFPKVTFHREKVVKFSFIILALIVFISWVTFVSTLDIKHHFQGIDRAIIRTLNPPVQTGNDYEEEINVEALLQFELPNDTKTYESFEELKEVLYEVNIIEKKEIKPPTRLEKVLAKLDNFKNLAISIPTKIKNLLSGGDFKIWQLMLFVISVFINGLILIWGFFTYKPKQKILWLNFWYCAALIGISLLLMSFTKFFTLRRIFEFSFIGFLPFMTIGLERIYRKLTFRYVTLGSIVVSLALIIIIITGNIMLAGGQHRYYYTEREDYSVEANFNIVSPSLFSGAIWAHENLETKHVGGDSVAFDTLGAFGNKWVHVHERFLRRELLNSDKLTRRSWNLLRWSQVDTIMTNKYMTMYPSRFGRALDQENIDKFDNEERLNKIYANDLMNLYNINENIGEQR